MAARRAVRAAPGGRKGRVGAMTMPQLSPELGELARLAVQIAAYNKRQADIKEGLAKLKAPPAGGKSKFGNGHWPQRTLYS